jgi:hypothetical protein
VRERSACELHALGKAEQTSAGPRDRRRADPGAEALGTTSETLYNYTMTASAWLQLGTSAAVWLVLPLGLGLVRLLRHELK